jgi:hypothetical protein
LKPSPTHEYGFVGLVCAVDFFKTLSMQFISVDANFRWSV